LLKAIQYNLYRGACCAGVYVAMTESGQSKMAASFLVCWALLLSSCQPAALLGGISRVQVDLLEVCGQVARTCRRKVLGAIQYNLYRSPVCTTVIDTTRLLSRVALARAGYGFSSPQTLDCFVTSLVSSLLSSSLSAQKSPLDVMSLLQV